MYRILEWGFESPLRHHLRTNFPGASAARFAAQFDPL